MVRAFIGLGANLGDPAGQILAAFAALGRLPATRVVARSSLYRSAPLGNTEQPEFVNAVACIETDLDPRHLLDALLGIELRFGRTRPAENAPRRLDLDLLLYADQAIEEPGLTVPHPRMHLRAFVLYPLAEIAPQIEIPARGLVGGLLAACMEQRIELMAP